MKSAGSAHDRTGGVFHAAISSLVRKIGGFVNLPATCREGRGDFALAASSGGFKLTP